MQKSKLRNYFALTKPGIIRGNLITSIAAFFFASHQLIDLRLMLSLVVGTTFVIAAGCVFNNILDRDIDKKMERTKKRALVTGQVTVKNALFFGLALGCSGIIILWQYTNPLSASFGLIGLFFYVIVYGYAKRRTLHSTLIGSISGAIPPVIGYTASTNTLDIGTGLLFIILVTWQMPHFYSIAIYRIEEYKKAEIPLLSIIKGVLTVKKQILFYTVLFIVSVYSLFLFGYVGSLYLVVMSAVGGWWLVKGYQGFETSDTEKWAKQMFGVSLVVLLVFSIMISIQGFLPFGIV